MRRVLDLYGTDFDAFGYVPSVQADPGCTKAPVQSDHAHDGLALLVQFWASPAGERPEVLKHLSALDAQGVLSDWTLAQRLLRRDLPAARRAALLARKGQQIADGPAYLRAIAGRKFRQPD